MTNTPLAIYICQKIEANEDLAGVTTCCLLIMTGIIEYASFTRKTKKML